MRQDVPITVPDLVIALQVCSETGVGRLGWRERWLGVMLTLFPKRFEQACRVFIAYSRNEDSWPKFFEKKEGQGGAAYSMPWELAVLCNLINHGVSYENALQMPETRAIWLSTAFAINDGAELHLLSTDDEALIDSLSKVEPPTK
jgi:hypothetical protein